MTLALWSLEASKPRKLAPWRFMALRSLNASQSFKASQPWSSYLLRLSLTLWRFGALVPWCYPALRRFTALWGFTALLRFMALWRFTALPVSLTLPGVWLLYGAVLPNVVTSMCDFSVRDVNVRGVNLCDVTLCDVSVCVHRQNRRLSSRPFHLLDIKIAGGSWGILQSAANKKLQYSYVNVSAKMGYLLRFQLVTKLLHCVVSNHPPRQFLGFLGQ